MYLKCIYTISLVIKPPPALCFWCYQHAGTIWWRGSMPPISSYEPPVLGGWCISLLELPGGGGGVCPLSIVMNPPVLGCWCISMPPISRVAKMYGLYGFLFCNPKIVRIVRILSWKYTGLFLIFTHFSKFFMKISKKNLVKMKLV